MHPIKKLRQHILLSSKSGQASLEMIIAGGSVVALLLGFLVLAQLFSLRLQLAHQLEEYLVCVNSTSRSLTCRQELQQFLSHKDLKISLLALTQQGASHAKAEFKVEIMGRSLRLALEEEIPLGFKF